MYLHKFVRVIKARMARPEANFKLLETWPIGRWLEIFASMRDQGRLV